jgi:hypothetical protein
MKTLLAILVLCGSAFATVWNVKTNCAATGNGSTDDTTNINTCITNLVAGDTLLFPSGTYLVTSALTKISKNNITIDGSSSAATILSTGSGATIFNLGGTSGTTGTQNLTSNAAELSQTINANFTSLGASAGSYILIEQGPTGASGQRGEVLQLASSAGSSAVVTTMVHDTFSTSTANEVANVKLLNTPVSGFNMHDIILDGSSHTAGNAINITNVVNSSFANITIRNFTGLGGCAFNGAALTACYHFGVTFSNINFTGIGNGGGGGTFQTEFNSIYSGNDVINGMSMTSGNGGTVVAGLFGFAHSEGSNLTVNNLTVDAATNGVGRPFKIDACRYSTFNNLSVTNQPSVALGDNGLTPEYFSAHNLFNTGTVTGIAGNTSFGIHLYGDDNSQNEGNVSYNTFYNYTVSVTSPATYAFGEGTNDVNNTILGGSYSGVSGNHVVDTTFGGNTSSANFYISGATVTTPGNIGIALGAATACVNNNTLTGSFSSGFGIFISGGSATGVGNSLGGNSSNLTAGSCPSTSQGSGALATPSPTNLSFGNQALGIPSSPKIVTLTNAVGTFSGTANLTFVGTPKLQTGTQFAISSNTCTSAVAPGGACSTSLTFTPTTSGAKTDNLIYLDNAGEAEQVVTLTGTGGAAASCPNNPGAYNGTDVVNWTSAPNLGNAINNGLTVFDTSFLGGGCAGGVCHNFDGSAFTNSSCLSPITRVSDSVSAPGVTNGTYVAGQGGSGVIVATNTNTSLVGFSGNGPEYVCLFNTATGHCAPIGTGIAIPTSFNNAGGGSAKVGENFGSIFFSLTDPTVVYDFGVSSDITTPTTVTPYSINTSTGHFSVGFPTKNAPIVDFKYFLPLGAANAPAWQAAHTYHYGDYVTHQLTSPEMAKGTGLRAASTAYALGDIVTQNGTAGTCMYKVTVAGTTSPGAAPAFLASGCKLDTFIDGTVTWRGTNSTGQFTYQNVGANGVLSNPSVFQWIHSPVTLSTNTCSMPLNSAVLTCTNAPFTAAMVGQTISVTGAGASGGVLYSTILTFTNSTVVSLAIPATTAVSSTNASLTGHPDLVSRVIDANGIIWTNVGPNYVPTLNAQAWTDGAGISRDTSYPGTSYSSKFGMAISTNTYGDNYPNGGYAKYNADQGTGGWEMEYDAVANVGGLLDTFTGIWTSWSCSGGTGYSCSGGSWTPSVIGTLTSIVNPSGITPVTGITTQSCPFYIHNEKMSKNGHHQVITNQANIYAACNPLNNFLVWQPLTSVFPFDALNSLQITFAGLNHWDIGTDKIMAFNNGGWGAGAFISIYDASNASTQAQFSTFLKPNINLTPPPYPQGCHTVSGTNPDCALSDVLDSHLSVAGDHGTDVFPACGTSYNYTTLGPAVNAWQNKETCYPVTPLQSSIPANSVNPVWQYTNDFNTHTNVMFSTQFTVSQYSQDANWLFWSSDWNCTLGSRTGSAPSVWSSGTHIGFLAVAAVPASPSSLCGLPWTAGHSYTVGNLINPIEGTGGSGAIDDVFQAIHVNGTSGPQSSLSGKQPKCGSVSCFTATTAPTASAAGSTVCDNQNYNGTTQLNSLNPALPYSTSCPNGVVWQDLGPQTGRGDVFAVKLTPSGGAPNLAVPPACSPGSGTYTTTQSVTCTDASSGAVMCFTTNGGTPATNGTSGCSAGTLYSTAISIAVSETLRIIAGGTGYLDSSVSSYVYTISPIAATPVCSPVGGTYTSTQSVSCTDASVGSIMCFTTNGTTPSTNGTTGCTVGSVYFGAITVAISGTLKVIAGGTGFTDGPVASNVYVINFPTAATPTFSPVAGTYNPTQSVTISSTSAGSIICWNTTGSPATNGITGCTTGALYSGPVSVGVSETLFAVAGGSGYVDSSVGSAAYVIKLPAATPVCTPGTGTYTAAQSVTCTDSSSGAIMCYTTNGSTPATNGTSGCTSGTLYSTAIAISGSSTLKVIGGGTAYIDGPVGSFVYTINFPTVAATPVCSPVGGTYTSTQSVTCTDASAGAVMCYTTTGASPATNGSSGCTIGTLYSGAISVAASQTLKAIAGGSSYVDSSIATYVYTINPVAATPSCSPVAGTYASPQSATCTDSSSGSIMCYTTNGGTPATNGTSGCMAGTLYSGAISVALSETLKVIGGGIGYTDGAVASYAYVITVPTAAATPVCSPVGGTYTVSQSVSCTDASAGAVMCFTTNGTTPSTNGVSACATGTLYSTAISISATSTLKVIAGGTSYIDSSVATNAYVISPIAATPVCSPIAGSYASAQSVTCTDVSSGTVMCFTTNGATPATNSVSGCTTGTVYSSAISVPSSRTIKIIAGGTGYTDGTVASYTYVINGQPVAPVTGLFARVVRWKGGVQLTWKAPIAQPEIVVNSYSVWKGSNPLLPNPSKIATVLSTSYFDKHCHGVCCYEVRANDTVGSVPTAVVSGPSNIACVSN